MNESDDGSISILKSPYQAKQPGLETPKQVRFNDEGEGEDVVNEELKNEKNFSGYKNDTNDEIARKKSEYISSLFPNSASPIENISFDGSDEVELTRNLPPPPFSPGVPGLISPQHLQARISATRQGVTPPKPPPVLNRRKG